MNRYRLCILLFSCLLSACTSVTVNQDATNQTIAWPERQVQLTDITDWQIQGAVSVKTETQTQTASISLVQHERQFELQIFGPLGIGRNILSGQPGKVTLKTGGGDTYQANDPEDLLNQQLGWTLPVSNLYYWLRGLPAPDAPAKMTFDQYHHLQSLQQQGWSITYVTYMSANQIDVPKKMILQRPYLRVVLIINQWQI